jgi:hypothetical protein
LSKNEFLFDNQSQSFSRGQVVGNGKRQCSSWLTTNSFSERRKDNFSFLFAYLLVKNIIFAQTLPIDHGWLKQQPIDASDSLNWHQFVPLKCKYLFTEQSVSFIFFVI